LSKLNQIKIPLNLITEVPSKWVILKIGDLYKVFGGWTDRWKLNSGIVKIEEDDEYFYFFGYSGSCYKCRKEYYGIDNDITHFTSYPQGILEDIINKGKSHGVEIQVMPKDTDWFGLELEEN
jgi:hypothetical protein